MNNEHNSGDDIAGIVHSVGANVYEFKQGDRVAAFHEMRAPHGSFAEYAVSYQHTAFHIPESLSFEEAATLPLAAMTSACGMYADLGLPEPWKTTDDQAKTPIVVYGAASAVGAYAIQLAVASHLHPIIGVAGRGIPFAEGLIDKSKGDAIVDYRDGDEAVVSGIQKALKAAGVSSGKTHYLYDAVTEGSSLTNSQQVLEDDAHVTTILPLTNGFEFPQGIHHTRTMVGCVHDKEKDFGFLWFRYLVRLIQQGKFKPHPHTVVPGGLEGVSQGLQNLKNGKASATKYVFRIAETPGLGEQ